MSVVSKRVGATAAVDVSTEIDDLTDEKRSQYETACKEEDEALVIITASLSFLAYPPHGCYLPVPGAGIYLSNTK